MTPSGEYQLLHLLERIAVALERLAPDNVSGPRKPAVLGTATYNREEKERKELRDTLHGKPLKVV